MVSHSGARTNHRPPRTTKNLGHYAAPLKPEARGPASSRSRKRGRTQRSLDLGDVLGLKALRALLHFKLHKLALVQRLVAIHLNCGEVNEDILPGLTLNKAVPLRCIEPLHHTLFSSQRSYSSSIDLPIPVLATPDGNAANRRTPRGSLASAELQDRISGGILAQTEFTVQSWKPRKWQAEFCDARASEAARSDRSHGAST
jgi:hypothetical protein